MNTRQRRRLKKLRGKLTHLQKSKCCYCGIGLAPTKDGHQKSATLEHLKPKVDGGTNHHSNLAVTCLSCNRERGTLRMNWLEFATMKNQSEAS